MRKYNNLDGLRTFAAGGVVCMHVRTNIGFKISGGEYTDYLINSLIAQFGTFVQLFFIISGFGMCCGYYEKMKHQKISLNDFYNKRYSRILPFFALLVLMDLAVSLVLDGGITVGKIYEAFANLTLMFGSYTTSGMSVIGVGWALGVIFGFYILFPFFVYLVWTKKRAWMTLIITMVISYISEVHFAAGKSLCFPWLCYFVAGGLIYLYRVELEELVKYIWVGITVTILGFILVFMVQLPVEGNLTILLGTSKELIGLSMIVIGAMCADTKLWCNPASKFISEVSFEIYLAHMMVFRMIEKAGLTRIVRETRLTYLIVCILTIVGVLMFAVLYKTIETKIRKRLGTAS